jgi:hypothetical protein
MRKIFGWLGMFALGSAGWWLGELWALPAAVILGAVGTGLGLYWGRQLHDRLLGDD